MALVICQDNSIPLRRSSTVRNRYLTGRKGISNGASSPVEGANNRLGAMVTTRTSTASAAFPEEGIQIEIDVPESDLGLKNPNMQVPDMCKGIDLIGKRLFKKGKKRCLVGKKKQGQVM